MINGEKIKEIFPSMPINVSEDTVYCGKSKAYIGEFSKEWWNAEYIEPTTENDLALIRTEGLDEEIRCTMCTNHMKSDRGCDGSCVVNEKMYKAVMDAIEKRIQSTTKNDLGNPCKDCSEKTWCGGFVCKEAREYLDELPQPILSEGVFSHVNSKVNRSEYEIAY